MRRLASFHMSICILLAALIAGCSAAQTTSVPIPMPSAIPATPTAASQESPRPLLMAHYMPWYQTPAVTGSWGWHWTMNHFNPNQKDASGQPSIASHYHPLTGPYDSSDDALLEYQVLLMKLSGIDGVIVDWYGFENFWDYGVINDSTRKLFQYVKKAGLRFAICYEDVTIKNMKENAHLKATDAYTHGQQVMRYMQNNWFGDEAYLKIDGRPVLFVFGNPPYFKQSSDWATLFSVLKTAPILISEDAPLPPAAPASFPWPPMSMTRSSELTQNTLSSYLTSFYQKAKSWDYHIASAFPGFHDIYKEAGVSAGYAYLDTRSGETFRYTLQVALDSHPDVIQLVTWNDYGEGTNIEPTTEYGYQYLEIVQDTRRASIDKTFPFTASDLSIPLQIFNLRQKYKGDADMNASLDQAFQAVISGRLGTAEAILSK